MNYTKPNDENYEDKPEDWLFCSLTFSAALGFLLPEDKGIIIDIKGDMVDLHPTAKRVIVFNNGKRTEIIDASERTDLKEGDWVRVISSDNLKN